MPFVDLLKIPLLLSAVVIVHKATIAPNPPPKSEAVARFKKRDTIAGIVNWVPTINMVSLRRLLFPTSPSVHGAQLIHCVRRRP